MHGLLGRQQTRSLVSTRGSPPSTTESSYHGDAPRDCRNLEAGLKTYGKVLHESCI